MRWKPIILALLLPGCAAQVGAGLGAVDSEVQQTIENVKKLNDTEAKAYIQVPCAIDLGAYYRTLTPAQRQGADLLCDPTKAQVQEKETMSVDTLRALGLIQ